MKSNKEKAEVKKEVEDGDCNGDCDYCPFKKTVPGTDDRIDREPSYYCGLFDE